MSDFERWPYFIKERINIYDPERLKRIEEKRALLEIQKTIILRREQEEKEGKRAVNE